jgi:hypothetical protein
MKKALGVAAVAALALSGVLLAQPGDSRQKQEADAWMQARLNPNSIKPSTNLKDWVGLKCRVYLRVDVNPAAGGSSRSSGVSFAGLGTINELPVFAEGRLSATSDDAIVVTGPNGHVWIPRDQVRVVEVMQNPSSEAPAPTTPPRHR